MPLYRAELLAKKPLRYAALIHDVSQVLYLPFDYDNGSYARDRSGYNISGTIYGATPVAGKIGMARAFDGVDDYVEIPDNPALRLDTHSAFSIALWVKLSGTYGQRMIGKRTEVGTWRQFLIYWATDGLRFCLRDSAGTIIASDCSAYTAGDWAFLVGVWTGSELKFYRDASLVGTPKSITSIEPSNTPIYIGRGHVAGAWTNGIVDEPRFYKRILSVTEIPTLMYRRI